MVFVVIFYAGNILVGKMISDLPPFTIACIRLIIAFVILIPIAAKSAWRYRFSFLEHKGPLFIMTVTGVTFFNTFIYGALQFTTATNVSVLETVIPVMTVILSITFLKERLNGSQWIGIIVSFIGAIWVVMNGRITELASIDWNIGDGIMIGAILSWAIYSIYVKKYMHLFPSFASLFVMTGISVILLCPIVLIEWFMLGIPTFSFPNHLVSFMYLGIFPSFIALVFYNRAVELLTPAKASLFLNFLPVVTMIGSYFWLGETLSLMKVFGSFLVICGVLVTTQFKGKRTNVVEYKKIS
ncbi:DMT family transporter [Radiobacillus deserti]|uniref:DMT family transporter n=1 Tax=Radiobacillus deserti TaxID=2594883 RepID=A0A516KIE6_9BACI|nr:DMT family transporter [Radiobacillus deserti]QDP41175.1 DMT family transporter [Radiobacillus deserti]